MINLVYTLPTYNERANVGSKLILPLIEMLEEKPLANISVVELVKRAGVARASYYNQRYGSKLDILSGYFKSQSDSLSRRVTRLVNQHKLLVACSSIAEQIYANRRLLLVLSDRHLFDIAERYLDDIATLIDDEQLVLPHQVAEVIQFSFTSGILISLVKTWINARFEVSIVEMTANLNSLMN